MHYEWIWVINGIVMYKLLNKSLKVKSNIFYKIIYFIFEKPTCFRFSQCKNYVVLKKNKVFNRLGKKMIFLIYMAHGR